MEIVIGILLLVVGGLIGLGVVIGLAIGSTKKPKSTAQNDLNAMLRTIDRAARENLLDQDSRAAFAKLLRRAGRTEEAVYVEQLPVIPDQPDSPPAQRPARPAPRTAPALAPISALMETMPANGCLLAAAKAKFRMMLRPGKKSGLIR